MLAPQQTVGQAFHSGSISGHSRCVNGVRAAAPRVSPVEGINARFRAFVEVLRLGGLLAAAAVILKTVRALRESSEDEMIACFLQGELCSRRFGPAIQIGKLVGQVRPAHQLLRVSSSR